MASSITLTQSINNNPIYPHLFHAPNFFIGINQRHINCFIHIITLLNHTLFFITQHILLHTSHPYRAHQSLNYMHDAEFPTSSIPFHDIDPNKHQNSHLYNKPASKSYKYSYQAPYSSPPYPLNLSIPFFVFPAIPFNHCISGLFSKKLY